jgi:hypothetical protein
MAKRLIPFNLTIQLINRHFNVMMVEQPNAEELIKIILS